MTDHEWSRARSDFNHGWLKNRFVVALYRADRIVSGAVVDETGFDALWALLREWPERLRDAFELVDWYSRIADPSLGDRKECSASYLQSVTVLRWQQAERPELKTRVAIEALEVLDAEICASTHLSAESVGRLRVKAQSLASAISDLTALRVPGF